MLSNPHPTILYTSGVLKRFLIGKHVEVAASTTPETKLAQVMVWGQTWAPSLVLSNAFPQVLTISTLFVLFNGRAQNNSKFNVERRREKLYTIEVGRYGKWSFLPCEPLPRGFFQLSNEVSWTLPLAWKNSTSFLPKTVWKYEYLCQNQNENSMLHLPIAYLLRKVKENLLGMTLYR